VGPPLRMNRVVLENKKYVHDVTACCFVGDTVISVSKDGTLSCWNINGPGETAIIFPLPCTTLLTSIAVVERDERVITAAVGSLDGSITIVKIQDNSSPSASLTVVTSSP
jgi:WD40 repeat protein